MHARTQHTLHAEPTPPCQLTLKNALPEPLIDTHGVHNFFREFHVTNLHTHGLHISGERPGDNIFTHVEPGNVLEYTYRIPTNHMGGTYVPSHL